jgi:hypothetical protein
VVYKSFIKSDISKYHDLSFSQLAQTILHIAKPSLVLAVCFISIVSKGLSKKTQCVHGIDPHLVEVKCNSSSFIGLSFNVLVCNIFFLSIFSKIISQVFISVHEGESAFLL